MPNSEPIVTAAERPALLAECRKRGIHPVAREIGVDGTSLALALLDIPVRRGTALALRDGLARRATSARYSAR